MSYTPTNWKSGDVVTSTKLNKLEQGVAAAGGGALLVNGVYDAQSDTTVLDKTAAEIWAAMQSGIVLVKEVSETETVVSPISTASFGTDFGYSFETKRDAYDAPSGTDYPASEGST